MTVLSAPFLTSGGAYLAKTLSIAIMNPIEVNPLITSDPFEA